MDICDPYPASVREHGLGADGKIVFDKFQVAQEFWGMRGQGTAEGKQNSEDGEV
jgi:hypothetical protein